MKTQIGTIRVYYDETKDEYSLEADQPLEWIVWSVIGELAEEEEAKAFSAYYREQQQNNQDSE